MKNSKIFKISAAAVMLTTLSGCMEPQHPVYGFTQLDVDVAITTILLLAFVGMWLWSVQDLIDFRKNLTEQSYRGEFFQWGWSQNTKIEVPGNEN